MFSDCFCKCVSHLKSRFLPVSLHVIESRGSLYVLSTPVQMSLQELVGVFSFRCFLKANATEDRSSSDCSTLTF